MRRLLLSCIAAVLLIFGTGSIDQVFAAEPGMLLPENLEARSQMTANKRTVTILIKEEDPKVAVELLNQSNAEYARKGWEIFSINTYITNEDFEGFFVTYQKMRVVF